MQPLSPRHSHDPLCSALSTLEMSIYVCLRVCAQMRVCVTLYVCAHMNMYM